MLTLVRKRALRSYRTHFLGIVAVLLILLTFVTLKQCTIINYFNFMVKKNRLLLLFSSIYQHYFFGTGYLFNLFFVVTNDAVERRSIEKWRRLIWATLLSA